MVTNWWWRRSDGDKSGVSDGDNSGDANSGGVNDGSDDGNDNNDGIVVVMIV